jgi:D-hydroxyproline dehydrogenase subunit alpha
MRELVVVGAGPAGMAAADAASRRGVAVTLIDSASRLGGQIYRQPLCDPDGSGPSRPAGPALPARFRSLQNLHVEMMLGVSVWSASRGPNGFTLRLDAMSGGRDTTVDAQALVLATGASELVLPFPGWELPGISTAGAAQALLKSQHVLVGRRVLVAGSGPFLLPVAASLADSGAKIVAVVEACSPSQKIVKLAHVLRYPSKVAETLGYVQRLAIHRVPFLSSSALIRCEGNDRVQRAVVARLDRGWVPIPRSERFFEVDAACVSFGFVPRLELCRQLALEDSHDGVHPSASAVHGALMATSVPGVFVAGELTGVGGAVVAELEGRLAGHAAASYLGRAPGPVSKSECEKVSSKLRRASSFADLLDEIYALQPGWTTWPTDSTILCRCEDVAWGTIRRAIDTGTRTVQAVRGLTRCGMGYCQGRTCGPALAMAIAAFTGACLGDSGDLHSRPVAIPVPLHEVAKWSNPWEFEASVGNASHRRDELKS